jgi:hypothetical protein
MRLQSMLLAGKVAVALIVSVCITRAEAQGPFPGWTDSIKIYINTTATGHAMSDSVPVTSTPVYQYPLLVRLTPQNFSSYAAVKAGGADIRFAGHAGAVLPYQVERWTTESGEVWVKVDTVHANNTFQFFVMYWGKADATDASNPNAVFDTGNGFQGVWHLGGGFEDATAMMRHGIDSVTTTGTMGCIGGGQEFREVPLDVLAMPSNASITNAFTISFWVNVDTMFYTEGPHIDVLSNFQFNGGSGLGVHLLQSQLVMRSVSNNNDFTTGCVWANRWRNLAVTLENGTITKYVDGKVRGQTTGFSFNPPERNTAVGRAYSNAIDDFSWYLDEIRECNVTRDSSWLKLDYESQVANSQLLIIGGVSCIEPRILIEPVDMTVEEGSNAFFSIMVTGTNVRYQWYRQYSPISGETGNSLTFTASEDDSGATFFCSIQGDCGVPQTSRTATLHVTPVSVLPGAILKSRFVAAAAPTAFCDISGRTLPERTSLGSSMPHGVYLLRYAEGKQRISCYISVR